MTDTSTKQDAEVESEQTETEDSEEKPESHEVDQEFVFLYNVGRDPRDTNIHLNDVMRIQAEKVRAHLEGREPDLENPGSIAGTPLLPVQTVASTWTKDQIIHSDVTLPVIVSSQEAVDEIQTQNKLLDERNELTDRALESAKVSDETHETDTRNLSGSKTESTDESASNPSNTLTSSDVRSDSDSNTTSTTSQDKPVVQDKPVTIKSAESK